MENLFISFVSFLIIGGLSFAFAKFTGDGLNSKGVSFNNNDDNKSLAELERIETYKFWRDIGK